MIFDVNSKSFVGGNQRSDIFDGAPIEITERFDKPTKNKTVAHGFILYKGEKYAYREVAFTEAEFREACIVANNDGGEFDLEILNIEWDEILLEEWGMDLLTEEPFPQDSELDRGNPIKKITIQIDGIEYNELKRELVILCKKYGTAKVL